MNVVVIEWKKAFKVISKFAKLQIKNKIQKKLQRPNYYNKNKIKEL